MQTYGRVIELAQRKNYRHQVEDREIYLENLESVVNNKNYDV